MSESKAEYAARLKTMHFAGKARPRAKTIDGVERRPSLDEQGRVGVVHDHVLGTETVDAHAFIHDPVKVLPKVEHP